MEDFQVSDCYFSFYSNLATLGSNLWLSNAEALF